MRKISYLMWGIILLALILSACGKLERGGTAPQNMAPEIFFTNIPPEGLKFSVNPRVYWYGTDKDGFIVAYQYAVIRVDVSNSWGGLEAAKDSLKKIGSDSATWVNYTARMNIFGSHVKAEKGHQRNVRMFAEMNPLDSTAQHIFLRAVDNDDGISEIRTRMFWRNNHAPEVFVDVDSAFVKNNFYCLPETTKTWKGIEISWHGMDTLDYPDERKQPEFYFRWELWGPYKDTSSLTDPYASKVDSSLDSIDVEGVWVYDKWITYKSYIFKNLENCPDLGYGWYVLKVWSRDDAFVSSEKPAKTFFRILKPVFRFEEQSLKTVLVLDATVYKGYGRPKDPSKIWPFYDAVLSEAGVCARFNRYSLGGATATEDSLSRYDLVILLNLAKESGISERDYLKYRQYMDVGGRLWIMGVNNFGIIGGRDIYYLADPLNGIIRRLPVTFEVASDYLGVEGVFFPDYDPSKPERVEFIAAKPFGSWGLPYLDMDTVRVKDLEGYTSDPNFPGLDFVKYGIPSVPYDILFSTVDFANRAPLHRRLYTFVSRHGTVSEMHQYPCGTTYIGPTYRTAELAFPIHLMKDPAASEALKKIVKWFWEDLP